MVDPKCNSVGLAGEDCSLYPTASRRVNSVASGQTHPERVHRVSPSSARCIRRKAAA